VTAKIEEDFEGSIASIVEELKAERFVLIEMAGLAEREHGGQFLAEMCISSTFVPSHSVKNKLDAGEHFNHTCNRIGYNFATSLSIYIKID
jgi:hypothetical protein